MPDDVIPVRPRQVLTAVALATFIHALDRGTLAVAIGPIQGELAISYTTAGVLLSAFFWTYVPGQFLAGWLSERIGPLRTLAAGLAVWSVASALSGLAGSIGVLLIARLAVGLGESATFPAGAKLLARHFRADALGGANGTVNFGLMLGNGASVLLAAWLTREMGWRWMFAVVGSCSLVWFAVARPLFRGSPVQHREAGNRGPGLPALQLARQPSLWATCAGQFCFNYPYFLLVTWMPLYLVRTHGLATETMASVVMAYFVLSAVAGVLGGGVADWMVRSGRDDLAVRKLFLVLSGLATVSALLLCAGGSIGTGVAGIFAFAAGSGLAGSSMFTIGQSLGGPAGAGRWVAMQNAVGSTSGLLAPMLTGWLVDRTGSFTWAFLVAAAVVSFGTGCWLIPSRKALQREA